MHRYYSSIGAEADILSSYKDKCKALLEQSSSITFLLCWAAAICLSQRLINMDC